MKYSIKSLDESHKITFNYNIVMKIIQIKPNNIV